MSDCPTDVAAGALRSSWTYGKRFVLLNNTDAIKGNKLVLLYYIHFYIFIFQPASSEAVFNN